MFPISKNSKIKVVRGQVICLLTVINISQTICQEEQAFCRTRAHTSWLRAVPSLASLWESLMGSTTATHAKASQAFPMLLPKPGLAGAAATLQIFALCYFSSLFHLPRP